jgi:hypothetical protein
MRASRRSLVGTICLSLLGGLGSAVAAQWGDAKVIRGTIADCVVTAPGTTTLVGVTSEGPRQIRDRVESCSFLEGPDAGWTVGDARLAGTGTNRLDLDVTQPNAGMWDREQVSSTVRWGTWEIVGPDGSWVGPWVALGGRPYTLVAEGTGAYAGLTLVAEMPVLYRDAEGNDGGVFEGLLYEGPPPPWRAPAMQASE